MADNSGRDPKRRSFVQALIAGGAALTAPGVHLVGLLFKSHVAAAVVGTEAGKEAGAAGKAAGAAGRALEHDPVPVGERVPGEPHLGTAAESEGRRYYRGRYYGYGRGQHGVQLAAGNIPKGARLSETAKKELGPERYSILRRAAQSLPGLSPDQGTVLLYLMAYNKTRGKFNTALKTPSRDSDPTHAGLGWFQLFKSTITGKKLRDFGINTDADALNAEKSAFGVADWLGKNVIQSDLADPACIALFDGFQGGPATDGSKYVDLLHDLALDGLVQGGGLPKAQTPALQPGGMGRG